MPPGVVQLIVQHGKTQTEEDAMTNLALPGNPRYQPKDLKEVFGYDNLARTLIEVELAALDSLISIGVIKKKDADLLTPDVRGKLFTITMSEVDQVEREITKHDIRALVRCMQEIMPAPLRRWVHVPLTSYDVLDTARSIQFVRTYKDVVRPKARAVLVSLHDRAIEHMETKQIGRTHGQHALPVTVGFWFATLLNRALFNVGQMELYAEGIVGKISGAVGAYNAQHALGIYVSNEYEFENRVLDRLELNSAPISTQILPPEPLAYYLYSCLMLSATFGQLGRDGRHLMRTEIAELAEPFEIGQVGSSTMAHKRNPVHFEGLEGMWLRSKNEFGKVLDTMISEHQRDLVGSSVARDFPILVVNLVQQLNTLLAPGKKDPRPFLERLVIDTASCERNLKLQGDLILAEPLYLALQMYGYEGDAHEVINHRAMKMVGREATGLVHAVSQLAQEDSAVGVAWRQIPSEVMELFQDPSGYVGRATSKTLRICSRTDAFLKSE